MLRPDGELVIMVYARWSLNYLFSIGLIRRAALLAAYPLARLGVLRPGPGMLADHLGHAQRMGLLRYLRMAEFTANTDGPGNPYAVAYDRRRVAELPVLPGSPAVQRYLHAPPLPLHRMPGQALAGWHLWVHLEPVK